jgi:hypothetical protein
MQHYMSGPCKLIERVRRAVEFDTCCIFKFGAAMVDGGASSPKVTQFQVVASRLAGAELKTLSTLGEVYGCPEDLPCGRR